METVKEKDIAQSTTAQGVRGLDAAGNPIKINAADLMALMPVATNAANVLMPANAYNNYDSTK